MAWTDPRTWVAGEFVTASLLNTHLRDNLNALKSPPTQVQNVNDTADYSTTSTTFVDVDATDVKCTITTAGGRVMVGFCGMVRFDNNAASPHRGYFDLDVDGTRLGGDDGLVGLGTLTTDEPILPVSFVVLTSELSAGSHTFKLQWKVSLSSNSLTLYAGAGTSALDTHPQFWAREVS